MSLDELLKAANELDEPGLDRLIHQVAVLRVSRKAQVLPAEEAQLLQQINQGVPTDLRAQYQVLRAKREAETLTPPEHQSLIKLSSQIEQIGADRLEALATLAQLRQVSLTELMQSLGIQPVTYV
jgi:ERCC4-type nuclease